MKTIRIRSFLFWTLCLVSVLPWISFLIAHFIQTGHLTFATQGQSRNIVNGSSMDVWPALAVTLGFCLAVLIVGISMRRFIIKPLEDMRNASEQIAAGDLDVQISTSRILEIAEVGDGFESMVVGLQHAFQQQTASEAERSFVVNAVAHDLRTPIFALRGYLEGLEQGIANTPDKVAMYVAVCKESAEQLDRLVNDLFSYTQLSDWKPERFQMNTQVVNMADVVQASVDTLYVLADAKKITLHFIDHSEPRAVLGDPYLLGRTINNILENAIRHTPETGTITLRCVRRDDRVLVIIHDSGHGFSSEDLPHIFEPLYRGDESRNRATGGAGLGLAISRRIMRQHGGDIQAENAPSGGAMVTIWLPASTRSI